MKFPLPLPTLVVLITSTLVFEAHCAPIFHYTTTEQIESALTAAEAGFHMIAHKTKWGRENILPPLRKVKALPGRVLNQVGGSLKAAKNAGDTTNSIKATTIQGPDGKWELTFYDPVTGKPIDTAQSRKIAARLGETFGHPTAPASPPVDGTSKPGAKTLGAGEGTSAPHLPTDSSTEPPSPVDLTKGGGTSGGSLPGITPKAAGAGADVEAAASKLGKAATELDV